MPQDSGIVESIGGCAAICIWMYFGYISLPDVAGEVENPQLIPKAVIISLPLVTITYVLSYCSRTGISRTMGELDYRRQQRCRVFNGAD